MMAQNQRFRDITLVWSVSAGQKKVSVWLEADSIGVDRTYNSY